MYRSATKTVLLLLFSSLACTLPAQQEFTLDAEATSVVLTGTSTFKNWEMRLQDGRAGGSAVFAFREGELTSLDQLEVRLEAEGLKSQSKGMNRDAYEALNTEQFPYLTFELAQLDRLEDQAGAYRVAVTGELTISGVSKTVELEAVCNLDPDQTVTCNGSYTLNMIDYGVEPPKTMLGLVKAGEEVAVTYRTVFVPR